MTTENRTDSHPFPAHWLMAAHPSQPDRWTGSDYYGDGYDFMESCGRFRPVPSWGADGWDLGDWPYVIVALARVDGRYYVLQRVEGDLDVQMFDDRRAAFAHIDDIARFYWEHNGSGPSDLDAPAARGPYGDTNRASAGYELREVQS